MKEDKNNYLSKKIRKKLDKNSTFNTRIVYDLYLYLTHSFKRRSFFKYVQVISKTRSLINVYRSNRDYYLYLYKTFSVILI